MKNILIIILFVILSGSCKKGKHFDVPNNFQDDFESYAATSEMLLPNDQLWTLTEITRTENAFTIDTINHHTGSKSLKFFAAKSNGNMISKCSIAKQHMTFLKKETIRISAWYFIEGTQSAEWLFLLDLEELSAIGACPGMRLALANDQLFVEYKFFDVKDNIFQSSGQEVDFLRNQWVELIWEVNLSKQNKGYVKLWQNGQLIIDQNNIRTLPKDVLYFTQGTKGMYSSVEFGITANSKDNDLTVLVDDIKIEKVN